MKKVRSLIMVLFISMLLLIIPNISKAAVDVTRNIYSNDGSMKFTFTGIEVNNQKEYEFGLTASKAGAITNWTLIPEENITRNSIITDIQIGNKKLRDIVDKTDTGYVTIREKDATTNIVEAQAVDFKIPYLRVTNYTVLNNGKEFESNNDVEVMLRNADNSNAYYQYKKIEDINIINKYKEIKAKNEDINQMQNMLSKSIPESNWNKWSYWNGYGDGAQGFGHFVRSVNVPDSGLYYAWLYFAGKNGAKDVYGYIIIDNLEPDIALEGISLPKEAKVEIGKNLTLKPTFNPETATNKIVTWTSSDTSVATIDNAGVITPKKVGSTIITVVSKDGNRRATCTVTITEKGSGNSNETNQNGGTSQGENNNNGKDKVNNNGGDTTTIKGVLPKTGVGIGIFVGLIVALGLIIISYKKYKKYSV